MKKSFPTGSDHCLMYATRNLRTKTFFPPIGVDYRFDVGAAFPAVAEKNTTELCWKGKAAIFEGIGTKIKDVASRTRAKKPRMLGTVFYHKTRRSSNAKDTADISRQPARNGYFRCWSASIKEWFFESGQIWPTSADPRKVQETDQESNLKQLLPKINLEKVQKSNLFWKTCSQNIPSLQCELSWKMKTECGCMTYWQFCPTWFHTCFWMLFCCTKRPSLRAALKAASSHL